MGWVMAGTSIKRARIAALLLSFVGAALASGQLHAQAYSAAPTTSESPSAALARYMRTLATSPKDFTALIGAGRAALELGDTQSAAGFFGRADEVFTRSPLPHAGMGATAVADGDAAVALTHFARAQQLGATPTMIGADRGLAYDLLGRHAEAQADYRAAMAGRDGAEARRRLALSLAITGDKAGALAQLGPLVARGDAAAARCRALILALTGDAEGARRSLDLRMPGSGAQMAPFFRRLPSLRSDQKAAAVHLGIFPDALQSGVAVASAVPVPSPAPPRSAPATSSPGTRVQSIDDWLRRPILPPSQRQAIATTRVAASTPVPSLSSRSQIATGSRTPALTVAGKEKIWLQLASGANSEALPEHFRRLKARNRELLEGISGYVAESADRARLLIGPFRNRSEAEIFAEDLESSSVDAFSWTSPPGAAIRKLSE